jgi:hypothetical protein
MKQTEALINYIISRSGARKCAGLLQDRIFVVKYSLKGSMPGVDLISFPLGGKAQAVIPVLVGFKAAVPNRCRVW